MEFLTTSGAMEQFLMSGSLFISDFLLAYADVDDTHSYVNVNCVCSTG